MRNKKLVVILITVIIVGIIIGITCCQKEVPYVSYKEFYESIENENIEKVTIYDESVEFKKKNDETIYQTTNPESESFKEDLLKKGIEVKKDSSMDKIAFVFDAVFYLIFFGMVGFGAYKLTMFVNKDFKVVKKTNVSFDDIAGMEDLKNEMRKAVEVLKNQKEYKEKGIRPIKGIVLEGQPGNGKTLFAKALATETDVKFIATKGADFQSAMMSMGARKIKLLFKKAKKNRPCIIFIDEFDGIGERRNYAGTGVDKENNRIITAMLNEMDGFDTQSGILVIAATNSYASLDPALIRPGRFDIKYTVSNPDYDTRIKLIELYTKNKKLSSNVDINKLADSMENISCSGIETILNEASMIAEIAKKDEIVVEDIINAARKVNCSLNIRRLVRLN